LLVQLIGGITTITIISIIITLNFKKVKLIEIAIVKGFIDLIHYSIYL